MNDATTMHQQHFQFWGRLENFRMNRAQFVAGKDSEKRKNFHPFRSQSKNNPIEKVSGFSSNEFAHAYFLIGGSNLIQISKLFAANFDTSIAKFIEQKASYTHKGSIIRIELAPGLAN